MISIPYQSSSYGSINDNVLFSFIDVCISLKDQSFSTIPTCIIESPILPLESEIL